MTQIDFELGKITGIWVDGPTFMFKELGLEVELVETKVAENVRRRLAVKSI